MKSTRVLALVLLAFVVGSCATESGSGFSREASRERSARNNQTNTQNKQTPPAPAPSPTPTPSPAFPTSKAPDTQPVPDKPPPPPPSITIHATPAQARISKDGWYLGTGSAQFDSRGFGQRVTVTVEAPSYRPQTLTFSLWGQTDTVDVDLVPITGTLEVLGDTIEGASITFDGQLLRTGPNRVLIGDHAVRVARFGYVGQTRTVTIREDETTTATFHLEPAAFDLTDLKSDRPEGFNPDSANVASTLRLSFQATAPGHALLVLTDRAGVERGRWEFPLLSSWGQKASWSGKTPEGEPLPDGAYTVTLTGGADADTIRQTLTVVIDRTLLDRDRTSLGPAAGLLWAPTAEVLSPGTMQISALGMGHVQGGLVHAPISASVRFSPARDWEWFAQTSARLWSDPYLDSGYATFAVKQRLNTANPGFRAAWLAGATVGSWLEGAAGIPPTDFLTTFPALRASLPVSWSWGRWTLMLAPEVDASYWAPSTAYEVPANADEGFRVWGYGRAGVSFDPGPFSLALSGAARTRTVDSGAGFLAPLQAGFEARWPIPETAVTVTGYLSVSAYSTVDYAWYGGFGVSLLIPSEMTLDLVSQATNSP